MVFPLLLLVVLGIVDFGFMFQRLEVLTNAAREGARVAVLPGYDATDVENRVMEYVASGGVPTGAGNPTVTVTTTAAAVGLNSWPATTVNVSYQHSYMFLGAVAGWFGGSFSSISLETEAMMRNEISAGGGP